MQIDHEKRRATDRVNHLHRLPLSLDKSGAQDLMSLDDFLQALIQILQIEGLPKQAISTGKQICGTPWLQLIEEPESLLGKGEGDHLRTGQRH